MIKFNLLVLNIWETVSCDAGVRESHAEVSVSGKEAAAGCTPKLAKTRLFKSPAYSLYLPADSVGFKTNS